MTESVYLNFCDRKIGELEKQIIQLEKDIRDINVEIGYKKSRVIDYQKRMIAIEEKYAGVDNE